MTSGFIAGEQWYDLNDLSDLKEDAELSIQLDRWILVEACKQLHNFIAQYPKAKLIINLNIDILLKDKTFPELISKLLTIIGSKIESHWFCNFQNKLFSLIFQLLNNTLLAYANMVRKFQFEILLLLCIAIQYYSSLIFNL